MEENFHGDDGEMGDIRASATRFSCPDIKSKLIGVRNGTRTAFDSFKILAVFDH